MAKPEEVIELRKLTQKIQEKSSAINKLLPKCTRAQLKAKELESTLKYQEHSHEVARKTALISSLTTAFSLSFIPLIGVWFALVPISLLINTIVNAVKMFNLETKMDNTKKDQETCDKIVNSYKSEIHSLECEMASYQQTLVEYVLSNKSKKTDLNETIKKETSID